jgi:hypothetical protein
VPQSVQGAIPQIESVDEFMDQRRVAAFVQHEHRVSNKIGDL